jgi:hypothetical protein
MAINTSKIAGWQNEPNFLTTIPILAPQLGAEASEGPDFKDTLDWIAYRQGDFRAAVPLLEEGRGTSKHGRRAFSSWDGIKHADAQRAGETS